MAISKKLLGDAISSPRLHETPYSSINGGTRVQHSSLPRHDNRKRPTNSTLAKPQTHNRFLLRLSRPRGIPSNILDRHSQPILLIAPKAQPAIPLPIAAADDLVAAVLLGHGVAAAEALEEVAQRRRAGHVRRQEGDLRVGGQLPRRRVRLEDVHLGVLGGEEVVVARLAAHAARRVGHLRGGHGRVQRRAGLWMAGEDVARAVGLDGEGLLGLEAALGVLRGRHVGCVRWHWVSCHGGHRVSHVGIVCIRRLVWRAAEVVAWAAEMRNVGLALRGDGSSSWGKRWARSGWISSGNGVPARRHDECKFRGKREDGVRLRG